MILVDSDVSEDWDSRGDWHALAERAVWSGMAHSRFAILIESAAPIEVSVKYTTDGEVRALNARYRDKDRPTNVLSFPMAQADEIEEDRVHAEPLMLGDIVLAHGVCAAEAAEKGVTIDDHAAHLLVHGTLHLLGYDHEAGEAEAEEMEAAERRALAAMGIADPYAPTGDLGATSIHG